MIRCLLLVLVGAVLLWAPGLAAQQEPERAEPIESGIVEQEEVRLVIVDVVVVDKNGGTVPDLTADDFAITADGKDVPVGTLDVSCSVGAIEEPRAVRRPSKRERPVLGEDGRRIVFAFDYLHLAFTRRAEVIESAMAAVEHNSLPGDEIMVVALNGGLRIEQPFTTDTEAVIASLKRMNFDITLWQPYYFHSHEGMFVDPLVALLDLLGQYPGHKAVVLYSEMRSVPLDTEFERIAAVAAVSRCSIYPVDAGQMRVTTTGVRPATVSRTSRTVYVPPGTTG